MSSLPLFLYLSSIFLVSFGASKDSSLIILLGLVAVVIASIIIPINRFLGAKKDADT